MRNWKRLLNKPLLLHAQILESPVTFVTVTKAIVAENHRDSSLALIWHSFHCQASLGVKNPIKLTADSSVAPLDSIMTLHSCLQKGERVSA